MHRELLTEIIHAAQQAEAEEESGSARRLHAAFGAIVADGIAAGEIPRRHSAETLTEMILGAYYALMFNWANLEAYPIAERARAAAAFLSDALVPERCADALVPERCADALVPASPRAKRRGGTKTTALK